MAPLADPRLPGVVDDVALEFGNALYQHTIDRLIAGEPVADADLRWRAGCDRRPPRLIRSDAFPWPCAWDAPLEAVGA